MTREEVWLRAWEAAIHSQTKMPADLARHYADQCLKDFDHRFPQEIKSNLPPAHYGEGIVLRENPYEMKSTHDQLLFREPGC